MGILVHIYIYFILTFRQSFTKPGEADPEVQKRSGEKTYNVKLTIGFMDKEDNVDKEKEKMEESDMVR